MLSEFNADGVLIAPIVIYALAAIPITWALRYFMVCIGIARWLWHGALVDVCLYAVVLFVTAEYL